MATEYDKSLESGVAIYRDVTRWPRLFPMIRAARVVRDDPRGPVVEVDHVRAGKVVNVLATISPSEIELNEFKPRYNGRFVNRFEPVPEGTRYTVISEIRPKGHWRLVAGPWLAHYVRREIARHVLEPVRRAAEARSAAPTEPARST